MRMTDVEDDGPRGLAMLALGTALLAAMLVFEPGVTVYHSARSERATPLPVDKPGERSERCRDEYQQYKAVCDGRGQTTCPGQTMLCREAIARFRDAAHCASRRTRFMEVCRWEPIGSKWWKGHLDAAQARLAQGATCLKLAARSCSPPLGGGEASVVTKGRQILSRLSETLSRVRGMTR